MVGGRVIEVVWFEERLFVDLRDTQNKDTCAIYIERNVTSEQIDLGDMLWWQGKLAMWTPLGGSTNDHDIKIPRIGGSGVRLDRTAAIGL